MRYEFWDSSALAEVAKQLNREGFHPPKRSATFTSVILSGLLAKRGRTGPRPRVVAEPGVLGEHEWLLTDLARKLAMPHATLPLGPRRLGPGAETKETTDPGRPLGDLGRCRRIGPDDPLTNVSARLVR